jgi:ribosomal protein L29
MKYKELIQKSDKELTKELSLQMSKLRELRFDMATRENKNTKSILGTKKNIARILTLKKERELAKLVEEEKKNA